MLLPDLILLVMRMSGRNGITMAHPPKAKPGTQHIPIIFQPARVAQDDRLWGLRAGGVDYTTKPFFAQEIQERMRIHLVLTQAAAPGVPHPGCPNRFSARL